MEQKNVPVLPEYSVLMSVYCKEKAGNLSLALESMATQTLPPAEIVLVEDGPLTEELYAVIEEKKRSYPGLIVSVPLPKNVGLGYALNEGIKVCRCEYMVRMDSDDISFPDRCEKQMTFLAQHPEIDIISGTIAEFDGDTDNITGYRRVPLTHSEIREFAKSRSPFNHVAVVFRKSAVERAGLYRGDLRRVEDHDLWMRLLRTGAACANIPDTVVYVRFGDEMHKKRHGLENAKALRSFYREMYTLGEISYAHYLFDITCACGLQFMPAWLHKLCYKFLRREKKAALPPAESPLFFPTSEEIRASQLEILEIYKDVKAVCDKYGLQLPLSGGSLLGAMRHSGFIPWDDDMDVVMPRRDYETFKNVFDAELGDRYELQAPSCPGKICAGPVTKVIRRDSVSRREITAVTAPGCHGAWLDILPTDYAPAQPVKRIFKVLAADALEFLALCCAQFEYDNPLYRAYAASSLKGKIRCYFRLAVGAAASVKPCAWWFDRFDSFVSSKTPSEYVTHAAGIRHYLGEMHKENEMYPVRKADFEGLSCDIPAQPHLHLKKLYGSSYMVLPPVEKRVGHGLVKPELVAEYEKSLEEKRLRAEQAAKAAEEEKLAEEERKIAFRAERMAAAARREAKIAAEKEARRAEREKKASEAADRPVVTIEVDDTAAETTEEAEKTVVTIDIDDTASENEIQTAVQAGVSAGGAAFAAAEEEKHEQA